MIQQLFKFFIQTTLLLFVLVLRETASANGIPWDKLHGMGQVQYFAIGNPKKTKNTLPYHVFVRLPDEYEKSDKQNFPVLYLLDGGTTFPLFAASYTHLRWMEDIPPMIIVGISYGTHDWRKGNDRSHDFTVPSIERDHWGGAPVFEQFFTEKLMPTVQKKYRVDEGKQILFGQSLGGQFGLYSSMYGKAPFYGIIASNPGLHRNLEYFKQPMRKRKNMPKVFVSIAEFDDEKYKTPSTAWVAHWNYQTKVQKLKWQHKFVTLDNHNHMSATPDVLRNGLMWMFEK